ncbi:aminoglycoside 3'-phosphotransferase [Nocardia anaemiae]|uniref:aminoglycoside 3'-phosphotransferase n=1 Tax=Nocardia anaemiae TaxID=263910 RepID=UPI000A5F0EDE|nr:phosphotransferase [Nocardia anaemiae]
MTDHGYRFDERLRMIPTDHGELAARVAAARPVDFAEFRKIGIELMLLGRYAEALDHLDRALELADSDYRRTSVWINLGDVYRYWGDTVTAETLYRRAVDRASDSEVLSFALQHLGKALAEQGRLSEARARLTEALKLRVVEGDAELIESTRTTLDLLDDLPTTLPPRVAAVLGDHPAWSEEHEGMSGDVAHVDGAYWVKRGPRAAAELARLNWLRDKEIQVPRVAVFEEDVLVLADAGLPSLAAEPTASVGAVMGGLLRRLHDIPVAECPFDAGLDVMLAQARRRVLEGLVVVDDFDDDNRGSTPEQIYQRLLAERPPDEDLVVAHGDFTPSNVLAGGLLIDVGGLGVADRYRDLALVDRDLREDFDADELSAFYAAYGLAEPDRRRLDYYRLLDELF